MEKSQRFHDGIKMRSQVVGEEFVKQTFANLDDFNKDFQELITEYCWGEIWARPGLPLKTRSMLNMAMLTALNKPDELKGHIRGALKNGCTKNEIKEVLLQCAVYCGMPAGVMSFKIASGVFKEENV